MVHIEKLQAGLARFIDREVVPALSGWEKVIIGSAGGIMSAKLPDILSQYFGSGFAPMLGIYDAQAQMVDIEAVYNAVLPRIGEEKLPIKLPGLGVTLKIGKQEIDLLYRYIMEA